MNGYLLDKVLDFIIYTISLIEITTVSFRHFIAARLAEKYIGS